MIKEYYELVKPGLVYGNVLTGMAGFFVAGQGMIDVPLFVAMAGGLALVIASACVVNNHLDRALDAKMERTKHRPSARGALAPMAMLLFAALLLLVGSLLLFVFTTPLACYCALFAFVVYTALYSPLKTRTPHALWVGAIAGAMPPVVGYTAAGGGLDGVAAALFACVFVWQVPHFLAIAVFRYHEYTAGGVPLFIKNPPTEGERMVARKVFLYSLVVLVGWCAALMVQRWIR